MQASQSSSTLWTSARLLVEQRRDLLHRRVRLRAAAGDRPL